MKRPNEPAVRLRAAAARAVALARSAANRISRLARAGAARWRAADVPIAQLLRRGAILLLGAAAAVLLVATEFTTISTTEIMEASCDDLAERALADGCETKGGERHGYTLVVLGLVAGAMAWGAGRRESRPAAIVLLGIGGIAALVALAIDLPTLGDTGTLGQLFTDAHTRTETGFWLEIAGAIAAIAAGVLGLAGRRPAPVAAAAGAATPPPEPPDDSDEGQPRTDAVTSGAR